MKNVLIAATFAAAVAAAGASGATGVQLVLSPSNVIGSTPPYNSGFNAGNVLDQQSGPVFDSFDVNYWLNPDNGTPNAYITIDLGAAYHVSGFELFNTHNSGYGDRGTGKFSIAGSNSVAADGGNGFTLGGAITTLTSGALTAAPVSDPIAGQSFGASGATVRYIQFLPTSVATANASCCGANNYGLNELYVFVSNAPEPATWSLMVGGMALLGLSLRRRRVAAIA